MNRTDSPKKQPVPFAVNGQRENLLNTTPAGDNTASYDAGFPAVTMILKAAGGLPPKGQDMNQILYELSLLARWSSAGALNTFDSAFATGIGGYPKGSVLISNASSDIFISTVDANTNDPNSVTTGWLSLLNFLGGAPLNSPVFTGTPTLPTAPTDTSDSQAASTAFVQNAILAANGRLLNVQILTNSGTYVPTSGTKKIVVEATGAGGGGGGANAGGRSGDNYIYSAGGGGGAGAYAKFVMTTGFSNLAFNCGKGGLGGNKAGASNNFGSPGGQTTFGNVLTAPGGAGGNSAVTNNSFNWGTVTGGGYGADVPSLSNQVKSLIQMGGSVGGAGQMNNANGGCAGVGANTVLGFGGFGATNGPGGEARGYGSGGGGALTIQSNTNSQAGGNGGNGFIIVWEYA